MEIFLCIVVYLLIGLLLDLAMNTSFTPWTLIVMVFWPIPILAGTIGMIFKR